MQVNFTINIDDRLIERIKKFFTRRNTAAAIFVSVLATSAIVYAAAITKPWDFNNGDVIDADKINDNFDEIYEAVNLLQGNNSGFQPGMVMAHIDQSALPDGWFLCDGSTFDATAYPKLATALGGNTLPDLRGRVVIGKLNMDDPRTTGNASSITDNRNVTQYDWAKTLGGEFDGEVVHKITVSELPEHAHDILDSYMNISEFLKVKFKAGSSTGDEMDGIVKNGTGEGSVSNLTSGTKTTSAYSAVNNPIRITPPSVALYYIIKHD